MKACEPASLPVSQISVASLVSIGGVAHQYGCSHHQRKVLKAGVEAKVIFGCDMLVSVYAFSPTRQHGQRPIDRLSGIFLSWLK